MTDPRNIEYHARQLLIGELIALIGGDQLNLIQFVRELNEMTLPELGALRERVFEDLDNHLQPGRIAVRWPTV